MNTRVIVALLVSTCAVAWGRPQSTFDDGLLRSYPLPSNLAVNCRSTEVSPGLFKFNCAGVNARDITLSSEHILWLRGYQGDNQQLDIVVPNYRVEELIRAALKASRAGSTNVNILLKKPETVYDVQAQEGGTIPAATPSVNLQYEVPSRPTSVHYPTEHAYNPLSGPIREP